MRVWVVVVASLLAFIVGWMWSGSVAAQADPEPDDQACHYEIYGPVDDWSWSDGTTRGPVLLLNQCTGVSWQLERRSQTVGRWHRLSVSRN